MSDSISGKRSRWQCMSFPVTRGDPSVGPRAGPSSSEEVTASESSHIRELTMSRQTDPPDLMNPEQELAQRELQADAKIDEVEPGIGNGLPGSR